MATIQSDLYSSISTWRLRISWGLGCVLRSKASGERAVVLLTDRLEDILGVQYLYGFSIDLPIDTQHVYMQGLLRLCQFVALIEVDEENRWS